MKVIIIKILGIALFIQIAISCKSQNSIKIPIEFAKLGRNECIVAKGLHLNGKKINMIFDTGGSGSGIDQQTIDSLNLKPDTTIIARGAGGEMQIPFFENQILANEYGAINVNLALFPLPPAVLADGSTTQGLLGLGSLSNYYVALNFDEMTLTISESPITPKPIKESFTLKTTNDRGIRFIEGNLITQDGKTISGPMYFDTGNGASPLIINQKHISQYNFLQNKDTLEKINLGGIGPNKKEAYKITLSGFQMGSVGFSDVPVLVTNPKDFSHREDFANIGLQIIKKFNIIFDMSGEHIILSKSKYHEEPFIGWQKTINKVENKTASDDIFNAIKEGDLNKVKSFWESNKNLSKITLMSSKGNTPLQTAILANQNEIAKFLIEQQADLNIKNEGNGATALHLAVYMKNIEIIKLLLAAGADKSITDSRNSTPLQMAEMMNLTEAIELLK